MIVCHPLKLIFLKTKKAAGTSFEIALSKYCSPDCIITPIGVACEEIRQSLGFPGPQNVNYVKIGPLDKSVMSRVLIKGKYYNHMTWDELSSILPKEIVQTYKTVTLYRDPFDTLLSNYYFRKKLGVVGPNIAFSDWAEENIDLVAENAGIAPAASIDLVLHYEQLEESISELSIPGLWETFCKIRAKGNVRPDSSRDLRKVYDHHPNLVRKILQKCQNLDEVLSHSAFA